MIEMNKPICISVPELDCKLFFREDFFNDVLERNGGTVPCTIYPRPINDTIFHRWIDENICLDDGYGDYIERNWNIAVSNDEPILADINFVSVEHEEDGTFIIVLPQNIHIEDAWEWIGGAKCKGTSKRACFSGIVEIH